MITSIFTKSKSINLIIVAILIGLACFMTYLKGDSPSFTLSFALKIGGLFFISYFGALVLDFIVAKNSLTRNNTLEILLYGIFLLMIPNTTLNVNIIAANMFVFFNLRRIISLRSQKNVKKKIFDAAFWVTVAALFYPWALLFYLLLPFAIFLYTENKLRHWIIPVIAILAVLILAYCLSILTGFNLKEHMLAGFGLSFDFSYYNSLKFLVAITILLSFGTWSLLYYIKGIKEKKKGLRPAFYIIILAVMVSFLMVVVAPEKNGGEFLFMLGPLAVIIASYIETIKENWFREAFTAILVVVPFVLLFL